MFLNKFTIILLCFTVTVLSDDSCEKWMDHENFHLVHSGGACGQVKIRDQDQLTTKILNGKTATPGSLPWMAFIVSHGEHVGENMREINICGGSVINENYILSAAHCKFNESTSSTVTLGLHSTKCAYNGCDDSQVEKYHVKKIIRHPEFDSKSLHNDIALLRVDRSISFESPYINYICLPTTCELSNKNLLGEHLTMAGWGQIDIGQVARTLQKTVISVEECRNYSKGEPPVEYSAIPSQLCTEDRHTITCGGDSGGPLTYNTADRVIQVGVASAAPPKCTLDTELGMMSYFTRLTSFMPWILDNIEP